MNKKIKLFDPFIDSKEENATIRTLRSHVWSSGFGKGNVEKFEHDYNEYTGSKSCIGVSNGTSALSLALSLIDIKNKEVILPSLTFVATAHGIVANGGIPKFVDIEPDRLCIDPKLIQENINDKTRIVLPVHFGGLPSDLGKIQKLGKKFNLKIIEDAAHAVGASYKNKKIGSHGFAVCHSFNPTKNLSMPGGGAITLNCKKHKKFSNILKSKRWCGLVNRKGFKYDVARLGGSYFMNEISAAIGLVQLKKLDRLNNNRKKIAKRYFDEIHNVKKMPFDKAGSYYIYWIHVKSRNSFMKKMCEHGIETGIHYQPVHKMSYYNSSINLPVTELVSKQIVSLPMHANLMDEEVDKVIKYTNKFTN